MQIIEKNFLHMFQNVALSDGLKSVFSSAVATGLEIDKSQKSLKLGLALPKIVEERYFYTLRDELFSCFPFLKKVELLHSYSFEANAKFIAAEYRENIVTSVWHGKSVICASLLESAEWEAFDGAIDISFARSGKQLMQANRIGEFISSLALERFGIELSVHFFDLNKKEEAVEQHKPVKAYELQPAPPAHPPTTAEKPRVDNPERRGKRHKQLKLKSKLDGVITALNEEISSDDSILVEGEIFKLERKRTKSGLYLYIFDITDYHSSITVKMFVKPDKLDPVLEKLLETGNSVRILGNTSIDDYSGELVLMANEIAESSLKREIRSDTSPEKRVELHLHTKMSQTDAVCSITDYVRRAAHWGHKAVAVTDHGVLQAYPEAMAAAKDTGVKVVYGVEAYIVDDIWPVVSMPRNYNLNGEFVVFDIETTGLVKEASEIIEFGAVKIINGEITDRFSELVKPSALVSEETTALTNITNEMLVDARPIAEVLPDFLAFIGSAVLVAHNAQFDVSFTAHHMGKLGLGQLTNSYICTVELSRAMLPHLNKHKLDYLCAQMGIELRSHHRAVDDSTATCAMFMEFRKTLLEAGALTLEEVNRYAAAHMDIRKKHSHHAVILVKNQQGLKNLYELTSIAHLHHFYHSPKIPKSEFLRLREGLIMGSACEAGELFQALYRRECDEYIEEMLKPLDYLEIQPISNNKFMLHNNSAADIEELRDYYREIVALGEKYGKPVVAACDAHFLDEEDEILRHILHAPKSEPSPLPDRMNRLYFRTTDEMLAEFAYLGEDKAYEAVVTNPGAIADSTEKLLPVPNGTFPPKIEGAEDELTKIAYARAKEQYGDTLPDIVAKRLERELGSIIKNGFAVMYIIAEKLVNESMKNGYLVGSRGSVGSSFVATMASITEVNPFPPHYFCKNCKYSDFVSETVKAYAGNSGCDMPDKNCPVCGTPLMKDGHDIPFETFLGFDGEKEPDIDLNFSGKYQAKAHAHTEELFGKGYVFKAGTIGTLAEKTALGYVRKYYENKGLVQRQAEMNRLTQALTGIKRTTGQHPGGLVIVPEGKSIYEFCPVQHPADDAGSGIITTHFDYHSISGRLLKLDILGHDVPTIIRLLYDYTGIDPTGIDLGDKAVISLFTSPEALGVTARQINCQTGSLGLPEFGTGFVRQMLMDTNPQSFAELVRISGLSHGTNVWLGNAHELIKAKTATLKEVIPTRDDIMVYLVNKGMEKSLAFSIMENVRKGKGVKDSEAAAMREADVPEWYIDSCKKISYMFPKGHAVAYVMMTVRIGWYKINYPAAFYAATFSVKAADFDYMTMCRGNSAARAEYNRLNGLAEKTAKDENSLSILEQVIEMYERGVEFLPLDLLASDAEDFKIADGKLLPPLCTIAGLGENAAMGIVSARADGEFISIEDFKSRTKLTKTVIAMLKENNILRGLSETNQLTLF